MRNNLRSINIGLHCPGEIRFLRCNLKFYSNVVIPFILMIGNYSHQNTEGSVFEWTIAPNFFPFRLGALYLFICCALSLWKKCTYKSSPLFMLHLFFCTIVLTRFELRDIAYYGSQIDYGSHMVTLQHVRDALLSASSAFLNLWALLLNKLIYRLYSSEMLILRQKHTTRSSEAVLHALCNTVQVILLPYWPS